jgi:hypothetical protein
LPDHAAHAQRRLTRRTPFFAGGAVSAADTPAYSFTGAPTSTDTQLSLGFSFSTTSTTTVTSLGYYDLGGDGFATAHEVGIFDSLGTLLASVDLTPGTGDTLIGQFRYASITPLSRAAGETYVIAATTNGSADPWAYGNAFQPGETVSDFSTAAPITIAPDAALFHYQIDDVLRDPTEHFGSYTFYAGPNFTVIGGQDLGVPEPASWILMLGGFGLVGGAMRRRASAVRFG